MPRRLVIALLAAALAAPVAAQEADVVAAETAWAQAVVGKDFAALEQTYHDKLIYAHSTGAIESKEDYMERLRAGKQVYTAIDHDQTTVAVQDDTAVAHSLVTMRGKNDSGPFDNYLMMIHTWVRVNNDWKLLAHQTTLIREN